ncbi:hypothetical protein SAMN05216262_10274 [Colwellia chukchiensis]|uniref:Uncharacterized protein n=1 Tax=Colwellia chukchiensis TaxID=641665 RepID=A0A1H7J1G0_9GAMM|nr:hypothetical protein [Colwellia chukchiensis]SEK66915.1 hypothetical protein SAMN05216262_10274 [Colwellia chukchiensis]
MNNQAVGLGSRQAKLIFYIANRPPLPAYQQLTNVNTLAKGDIANICTATGNHWRKVFNVYAKLLFELAPKRYASWQALRDEALLQAGHEHCLLFSAPKLTYHQSDSHSPKALHIIIGKGYAEQLGLSQNCTWLNEYFAINESLAVIICPYFDYRQLSNKKISQLVALIRQLSTHP